MNHDLSLLKDYFDVFDNQGTGLIQLSQIPALIEKLGEDPGLRSITQQHRLLICNFLFFL